MTDRLKALSNAGVSIWLDDLSRERLETGNLAGLIADDHVVGVTTNPSIFAAALEDGERYDAQVRELAGAGADTASAIFALTTEDVRNACDLMRPIYDATDGVDGRVSIEVTPDLADDTEGTVAQAAQLWEAVDRPNAYIKIPGTEAGWPAITRAVAQGIDVNVTLIFGLDQYEQVMEAYARGIEQAREAGLDISTIHSVASFFVSRVDTEIDNRLEAAGADRALFGRAGIANARLAYQAYERFFATERWQELEAAGANRQRPLWASTGVKNPDYDDTMYVVELVAPNTVNTMPEKTLDAVRDHGDVKGDRVTSMYADAEETMAALADAGIDYDDVIAVLTSEGVDKFVKAWDQVIADVTASLDKARAQL
jgi:transaldolase